MGLWPGDGYQLPCFGQPSNLMGLPRSWCRSNSRLCRRSLVNAESRVKGRVSVLTTPEADGAQFVDKNPPSFDPRSK